MRGQIAIEIDDRLRIRATPCSPADTDALFRLAGAVARAVQEELSRIAAERFGPLLWPKDGNQPTGKGGR